uniref:Uncharacterized protein n=1 Tax=Aegilops tauschii TaxID=37682 RepID=M8AXZ8_AEGTA
MWARCSWTILADSRGEAFMDDSRRKQMKMLAMAMGRGFVMDDGFGSCSFDVPPFKVKFSGKNMRITCNRGNSNIIPPLYAYSCIL